MDYAPITRALVTNDLIFHYATEYFYANQDMEPNSPGDVRLTDEAYQEFITWLEDKDLSYETRLEKSTMELVNTAKKEKKYEELKKYLDQLEEVSKHDSNEDLVTFKEEILMLLEQEIAGRYFYERGIIESTFGKDPDVQTAIEILNDQERYASILNPN